MWAQSFLFIYSKLVDCHCHVAVTAELIVITVKVAAASFCATKNVPILCDDGLDGCHHQNHQYGQRQREQ